MKRLLAVMVSIVFLTGFMLPAQALATMDVNQFAGEYKKTWKRVSGKTPKFLPGKVIRDPEVLTYSQLSKAVCFNVGEIAAGHYPYVAVSAALAGLPDKEIGTCVETMVNALLVGMSILAPDTKQAAANAVIETVDSMLNDSTADAAASSCEGRAVGDWFVHVDYDAATEQVDITVGYVPQVG